MKSLGSRVRSAHYTDYALLIVIAILVLWGLVTIFNSSYHWASETQGDPFYFSRAQLIWIVFAAIVALPFYFIPYKFWQKMALPMMVVGIIALVAVLIWAEVANGSRRWLELGPFRAQPAEFIKPVLIIYLASWLNKERYTPRSAFSWEEYKLHFRKELLPFLIILSLVGGLILIEPDLGTTLIIMAASLVMYLVVRNDLYHIIDAGIIFCLGIIFLIAAVVLEPYRMERLQTFIHTVQTGEVQDPLGSGFQTQQILIGVGSGGVFGKGFGQSRQKFGYFVEATAFTDSISAIVFEELGYVGAIVLLGLFWFIFYRVIRAVAYTEDNFAKLLLVGIAFWLVIQALIHFSVNLAIIPVTGVPLPYMAYGGSSLTSVFVGTALVLNVMRYRPEQRRAYAGG